MPTKPLQNRDNHSKAADDKVRKPVLEKLALHPRNRHRGRYDFAALTTALPELQDFLIPNPFDASERTINFADPIAVKTLNTALLKQQYGIASWNIPAGYLCPPIPGRADYLHHVADLLAMVANDEVPRGPAVRVLDIGVGANCIYPLIGQHEYGWQFVGTDVDAVAIEAAQKIVDSNNGLAERITLRVQPSTNDVFEGVVNADERFDIVICNPPFHASAQAAAAGSLRKWKNLGKARQAAAKPALNFGGQAAELWCEGGEVGFIRRMVTESAQRKKQVLWFTALVSKEDHLPEIYEALRAVSAPKVETIDMAQGQKKSRLVAWTFFKENDAKDWFGARLK
jgi:23S rRNA (adenine1618-N6)-methyltransferase